LWCVRFFPSGAFAQVHFGAVELTRISLSETLLVNRPFQSNRVVGAAAHTVQQHHLGKGHVVGKELIPKPIRGIVVITELLLRTKKASGSASAAGKAEGLVEMLRS